MSEIVVDRGEIARVAECLSGLLGTRYKVNGRGPDGFDCWSFTRHLQRALWDRHLEQVTLPDHGQIRALVQLIRDHPGHRTWRVVDRPVHSGMVELSHSRQPHHIGTWLDVDGGGVAHCDGPAGVSFDPLVALKAAGWRRFIFYEWTG